MRPRHLELTAFGPYAETVRIDFDELARDGLFLVHGPTGAGKTSLLDGMTYALYGGVAGTRRNDRLRSDHADPRVQTAVAFEFSLRGTDYHVTRVPPHERAKRTGTGTTRQKPKATLSMRAGDGWEPIAEGVEDVGQHIVDLVGLNREQFHQVVVLPQGDFATALHADANERRRLLSSLFRTGRFEDYTQHLVARAKEAESAAAAAAADVDRIVEQAAGRWSCILTSVEVVPDTVDEMALHASVAAETARTETAAAVAAEQAASAALEEGRVATELRQRVDRARTVLTDIEAACDELDDVRAQLAGALRAQPLQDYLDVARAAAQAAEDAAGAVADARRGVSAVAEAGPLVPLVAKLAGAETTEALLALRDDLQEAIAALQSAAEAQLQAQRLLAEAAVHEGAESAAVAAREHAEATLATLAEERAALLERREAACRAAERVPVLQTDHRRLVAQRDAHSEVERLAPEVEAAAAATLAAKQSLNEALDAHRDLLERRIDGMAGELAAALVDGDPCTVCGATSHPAPAAPAGDGVSAAALDEAAAGVATARAELTQAEGVEQAARSALATATAAAGSASSEDLAQQLDEIAAQLAATTATADELAAFDERLAVIATAVAAEQQTLTRVTGEAAAAAAARSQCLEQHRSLADSNPEPGPEDPAAAAGVATQLLTAATELLTAVEAQQRSDDAHTAAMQRLDDTLAKHGFDTAAQAEAAMLDAEIIEQYRTTLAELDRRQAAAEAVLAEHPDVPDTEPPDLARLRKDKADADAVLHAAQVRLGVVTQAADDLAELAGRWRDAAHAATGADQTAANLRRLADICTGTGNAQKMSLERYVLAAYFEEIADAASVRLQAMTDGRYTLRHSDERARGGAASGLSIVVHDAYTGTEREAGSLSGGETFQASLCLALGVADVVQRHAGGIHLDMLFIDEGFGALDADALEQAMAELDALREGGRLVGVISHVPALRERITSGIEVTKTTTGSDARVVVTAPV